MKIFKKYKSECYWEERCVPVSESSTNRPRCDEVVACARCDISLPVVFVSVSFLEGNFIWLNMFRYASVLPGERGDRTTGGVKGDGNATPTWRRHSRKRSPLLLALPHVECMKLPHWSQLFFKKNKKTKSSPHNVSTSLNPPLQKRQKLPKVTFNWRITLTAGACQLT